MDHAAIIGAVGKVPTSVLNRIASALSQPVADVTVRIASVFGDHIRMTMEMCSIVKTIASDEKPINLREIYVNLDLLSSGRLYKDYTLATREGAIARLVIKGTAGAGKTMLMKYLALETFGNSERIPIFINLRELASPREKSFIRSIYELCTPDRGANYGLFNAALHAGLFSFFFDGLDEINPAYQAEIFQQMHRFPVDFPKTRVTISSRPETETSSFSVFTELRMEKLSREQAVEIIEKTEFHDEEKKASFISKLKEGEFEESSTFLEIPLLCLLMFMTYADAGEIPVRAALFYEQAFDTLYSRHDTSKGPFRRIHRSGLQKDEFKKIFSLFCYRTLAEHLISFDNIELNSHLRRSAELEEISVDIDDLIRDLLESVCLLQRDGGKFHFIHRSFQEFFAASFLSNYRGPSEFEVFDRLMSDMLASKLPPLLFDLNRQLVERVWVLPALNDLVAELDESTSPFDALKAMVSIVQVQDSNGKLTGAVRGEAQVTAAKASALSSIYGEDEFPSLNWNFNGVRMYPEGYHSFRDYVEKSDKAPPMFKQQLSEERLQMERANRDRRSMSQYKINVWEIRLSEPGVKEWLLETEITKMVPRLRGAIFRLRPIVERRVNERNKLDILS